MKSPHWPSGLGVSLESGRLGFNSHFDPGDFSRLSRIRDIRNWYSSGYSARCLVI